LKEGPTVWIEVKTAPFKDSDLRDQVNQQRQALASLFPQTPAAVITLLPADRALSGIPNIGWRDLVRSLQESVAAMRGTISSEDYRAGYDHIASELIGRIRSHPNKLIIE